jgi:hypothetical protein
MSTPPSECGSERENNDRESNKKESNREKKGSDARHTKHQAAPHQEMGEAPPWMRAKAREPFVGDAAAVRLRNRLAREDDQQGDQVPPPPLADSSSSIRKGHIAGAMTIIIAAAAVGYLWRSSPPAPLIPEFPAADALGRDQADTRSVALAPAPVARPRLLVSAERPRPADQPARITVSAPGAEANVSVVITGLAPGSSVSAGAPARPNAWRLPTANLGDAAVTPPRGFVGVMNLTLELRLADETVVDRTALQLEWTGNGNVASSELPQRHIDAAELALLLKNGAELMGNGDIVAARLMFQRAAEAGDARAAFALAETFDPSVLEKLGTKGAIKADIAMAQRWYAKAKDLGSTAAPERLTRLTRSSQ